MAPPPAVERLIARIEAALAARTPLDIQGGGTKAFYGEAPRGEPLRLAELTGITSYEPTELVVTARAGTPLAELEGTLAERGQCLPFEPPRFERGGTVGGMVAAGLSGPARAAAGALRDYVLGLTLINGRAELISFGGQVMKNVAGYDVSRLLAGSWGVLGVICEVSLKVLGAPRATTTLEFDSDQRRALEMLGRWNSRPLPIDASSWFGGRLRVRLSGTPAAVESGRAKLGGALLDPDDAARWWAGLRDQTHDFFHPSVAQLASGECLWRVSLPATAATLEPADGAASAACGQLIEWNGAQRWWRGSAPAAALREPVARAGGHATLVRASSKSAGAFAPLAPAALRIHQSLKRAFDPERIFSPGRLYADL